MGGDAVSYRRRTAVSSPKYSSRSSTWRPIASNQASARSDALSPASRSVRPSRSQSARRGLRVEAGLGAADLAPGEEHRLLQRLGLGRHVLGGVARRRLGGVLRGVARRGRVGGPEIGKPGVVGRGRGRQEHHPAVLPVVAEHDERAERRHSHRGAQRHQREAQRRAPPSGRDVPRCGPQVHLVVLASPGGRAAPPGPAPRRAEIAAQRALLVT